MEMREEDIDLIEKCLANEANTEEMALYESKIQQDATFAARVALLKSINDNKHIDSNSFEDILENLHQSYTENTTGSGTLPTRSLKPYYYIAASLVLFIVAFFVIKSNNQVQSGTNLYAQYFTLPPENITTRDSGELNNHLVVAINAYRKQNFDQAIVNFNAYLDANPENDAANFYLGISYLANEQTEKSEKYLVKVVDNQDSIYRNAAQWYLSMAYLKSEKIGKAKSALEDITSGSSSYATKAKEILDGLPEK